MTRKSKEKLASYEILSLLKENKKVAGLRDVLIHQYFGVNYKSVWDITKNKVPKLKEQIEKILSEMEEEDDSGK